MLSERSGNTIFFLKNTKIMSNTALKHLLVSNEKLETINDVDTTSKQVKYIKINEFKGKAKLIRFDDNLKTYDIIQRIHKKSFNKLNNNHKMKSLDNLMNINSNNDANIVNRNNKPTKVIHKSNGQNSSNNEDNNKLLYKKEKLTITKHKLIDLRSSSKMTLLTSTDSGYFFNDNNTQIASDNISIRQNILNSMNSYTNFISNPLISNTNLVNPNFHQDLMGLKSPSIYSYSAVALNKTNLNSNRLVNDEFKHGTSSTLANIDSDCDKQEYFVYSSTLINAKTDESVKRKLSFNLKSSDTNSVDYKIRPSISGVTSISDTIETKKPVDTHDTDVKDHSTTAASSEHTHATPHPASANPLSRNFFLNYRLSNSTSYNFNNTANPTGSIVLNSNNYNNNNNNNNPVKPINTISISNSTSDKLNAENSIKSITSNSNIGIKRASTSKTTLNNRGKSSKITTNNQINVNILKHEPEKYLDKFTVLRIEKWIQDVNQTQALRN